MIWRHLKLGHLPTKIIIDEWFQKFLRPKPNYLGFAGNQAPPNIAIAWNFVNTFKNYRCSPAPLSVFFIQQKQRSLRLSCSLWSIDKWSGVMTLISDLVRSQLCMMGECPCSWWAGATLQLDVRYAAAPPPLSQMLLPARRLQYWLECVSRISTGVHTLDPLRWLSSWLCAGWAELGWAGNMTPWHGYDKSMTRVWWHIVSWSPDPDLATRLVLGSSGWGNVDHMIRCLAVMLITDQNCPQSTATSHSRPRGMCGY